MFQSDIKVRFPPFAEAGEEVLQKGPGNFDRSLAQWMTDLNLVEGIVNLLLSECFGFDCCIIEEKIFLNIIIGTQMYIFLTTHFR